MYTFVYSSKCLQFLNKFVCKKKKRNGITVFAFSMHVFFRDKKSKPRRTSIFRLGLVR
ncbi:unnamed protein product [Ixodes persulcatus]